MRRPIDQAELVPEVVRPNLAAAKAGMFPKVLLPKELAQAVRPGLVTPPVGLLRPVGPVRPSQGPRHGGSPIPYVLPEKKQGPRLTPAPPRGPPPPRLLSQFAKAEPAPDAQQPGRATEHLLFAPWRVAADLSNGGPSIPFVLPEKKKVAAEGPPRGPRPSGPRCEVAEAELGPDVQPLAEAELVPEAQPPIEAELGPDAQQPSRATEHMPFAPWNVAAGYKRRRTDLTMRVSEIWW